MALLELFVAAVVPCLALLWFITKKDRYEKEPFRMLLITYILGAFSIVPAVILELALSNLVAKPADPLSDIPKIVIYNLIVIAIVEESCKLLATFPAYRSIAFNEPLDGVVYAATASLGFATVENILYVLSGGWLVALLRAALSVPGHAFFGATMGFYLGQSKFNREVKLRLYCLVVPIILHTIYNVIVSIGLGLVSLLLAGLFILVLYRRVRRQIGIALTISPFRLSQNNFCLQCGARFSPNWNYCASCGSERFFNSPDQLTR